MNAEENDYLNQTVEEYLFGPCSESLLADRAADSRYWDTVQEFVNDNAKTILQNLSFKQRDWLIKIKNSLLEG